MGRGGGNEMDKMTVRIPIHGNTPRIGNIPPPISISKCDHIYREFRTECINDNSYRVFFYCQKCLDIQIKKVDR